MKNFITKQNKTISVKLKTVFVFLMSFTLISFTPFKPQKTYFKNIPINHSTLGIIPPVTYHNGNSDTDVWSFDNQTDCDVSVTTWFTATKNGATVGTNLWFDNPIGSSYSITSNNLLNLYGATGLGDYITLTHISFEFYIPGYGGQQEIYPTTTGTTCWQSAKTGNCGCLCFEVVPELKKVIIRKCNP